MVARARDLTRRGYCEDCGVQTAIEWARGLSAKDLAMQKRRLLKTIIYAQNEMRLLERAEFDKHSA